MRDADVGLEIIGNLCEFVLDAVVDAVFETGSADPKQPSCTDGLILRSLNAPEHRQLPQP